MFTFFTNIRNTQKSKESPIVNKDGKIGATQQGKQAGDCWLLSSVNALNETKQGQDIISSIFEYHNEGAAQDGYTLVHLHTGDYKIDDTDVVKARRSPKYSSGDDDMIILELAAEKALNSAGDEIAFHSKTPYYVEDLELNSKKSAIDSGNFEKAMYMLTGKAATAYQSNAIIKDGKVIESQNGIEAAINEYKQGNAAGKVMNASIYKKKAATLKDLNTGKDTIFQSNHQYAVQNIDDKTVTLINPWNSKNKLKISLDDFKNTFDQIEYIDLNEKRNNRKYTSDEYTTDGKNKNFIFRHRDGSSSTKTYKNGKLTAETFFDKEQNKAIKKFYTNDKKTSEIKYNKDGTKTIYRYDDSGKSRNKRIDIDENGYLKGFWAFNQVTKHWETAKAQSEDVKIAQNIINEENKNSSELYCIKNNGSFEHELSKLDKNGCKDKTSSVILSNEEYRRMQESGLLEYTQFSPKEIQSLLKANGADFKAAMTFIKSHPGIEYKYVQRYIR